MKTKGRRVHMHYQKSFTWWLRNNFGFIAIVLAMCIIVALIFGYQAYNFERVKSMEALLGKTQHNVHRETGLTDEDVSKLQKVYPNFNWEKTWDRQRWQGGQEVKKERNREKLSNKNY